MLNCNVYICMSVLVVDLFKLLNLTLLLLFTIFEVLNVLWPRYQNFKSLIFKIKKIMLKMIHLFL